MKTGSENIMKKILIIIILMMFLEGCTTSYRDYYLRGVPIEDMSKKTDYDMNYIWFYGELMNGDDKDSPFSYIEVGPVDYYVVNGKVFRAKRVQILSSDVRVVYEGKEYYLSVSKDNKVIKESTHTGDKYISELPLNRSVIRLDNIGGTINSDIDVYFGIILVETLKHEKIIIEAPVMRFKKYMQITRYNPILDGLNMETDKIIYAGPLEDYKKKK